MLSPCASGDWGAPSRAGHRYSSGKRLARKMLAVGKFIELGHALLAAGKRVKFLPGESGAGADGGPRGQRTEQRF